MTLIRPSSVNPGAEKVRGVEAMQYVIDKMLRVVRVVSLQSPTFDSATYSGGQAELTDRDQRVSVTTDGAGNATITFIKPFLKECVRVTFSSAAVSYVKIVGTPTLTGFSINGPIGATFDLHYNARGA